MMEQNIITGVAYSSDDAKITLRGVRDRPGVAAAIFGPLAQANINVDMIVQNISENDAVTDMTFTVPLDEFEQALKVIDTVKESGDVEFSAVDSAKDVAKVSVIGIGMRSHAGVANTMFHALAEKNINIQLISTSEIKISVLIEAAYVELAVRALHSAYGLDTKPV